MLCFTEIEKIKTLGPKSKSNLVNKFDLIADR